MNMRPALLVFALVGPAACAPLAAAIFTVNSVLDAADAAPGDGSCNDGSGNCTYRAALEETNALAGADEIRFSIPAGQCDSQTFVCTITPATFLPDIVGPVTIDGSTQPGNAAVCTTPIPQRPVYRVVLDGNGMVNPGVRFHSASALPASGASGSVLRGMNVRGFSEGVALGGVDGGTVTGVRVECNFIGTDATGGAIAAPPNSENGVILVCGANASVIGGPDAEDGNLVSGNAVGIWILCDSPGEATDGNSILGNYVGTDKSGNLALGNQFDGVAVSGSAGPSGNVIGALADLSVVRGNVIGGNGYGGIYLGGPIADTQVLANRIGISPNGTPVGNTFEGLFLEAAGVTIGSLAPGQGNTIAWNGSSGVTVAADPAFLGNAVRGNLFHHNADLAIDLGADGATANDPGDGDSGANGLQNYPVLQSVQTAGANFQISYTVDSPPPLAVDFYLPDAGCEGRIYLGSDSWAGGVEVATVPNLGASSQGAVVAIATDANGNTSEMSPGNTSCTVIFHDGFEAGSLAAWSLSQP
jgi:hypothetical protein